MAAASTLIFEIANKVCRAETHYRAKFYQNWSICCEEIAIFLYFFKHGHFEFGEYLNHTQRVLGGLYHCAKFSYDQCNSFDNMMTDERYNSWLVWLEMLVHTPFEGSSKRVPCLNTSRTTLLLSIELAPFLEEEEEEVVDPAD